MRSGRFVLAALAVLALWPSGGARARSISTTRPRSGCRARTARPGSTRGRDSAFAPTSRPETYSLAARDGPLLPAHLAGARAAPGPGPGRRLRRLPHHRRRPRERQLPVDAAAAPVPDPVRERGRLRQQRRRLAVPDDLGHALAGARRAAGEGHDVGRRRAAPPTTSRPPTATSAVSAITRPGLPGRRRRGQGRVRRHPGGRARRPVRQRPAHRLVGLRRRAGADRLRAPGGETSSAELQSTTLAPRALPSDANLLPLREGAVARFRWRNSRHMPRWSTQRFEVAAIVNNTARVNVTDTAGPIDVHRQLRLLVPARRRHEHVDDAPARGRRRRLPAARPDATGRRAGGASSRPTT